MTNSETYKNKKVLIRDNPVQYPDDDEIMDYRTVIVVKVFGVARAG